MILLKEGLVVVFELQTSNTEVVRDRRRETGTETDMDRETEGGGSQQWTQSVASTLITGCKR